MGDEKMMNKRGGVALRDIMFMIIIFGAVLSLASYFVVNISDAYSNDEMKSNYNSEDSIGTLGDTLFVNVSGDVEDMKNATTKEDGALGSFSSITGAISGAASILGKVILSPVYVGKAFSSMMSALSLPETITKIMFALVVGLLYITIIFVTISALLKGGKV